MKIKLGRVKIAIPPTPSYSSNMKGDEVFIVRYVPVRTPWFDVIIRRLMTPNLPETPLHCHGVDMYTLCFWGGYDDVLHTGRKRKVRIGTLTRFKRDDYHTVTRIVGKKGAWTLGLDARWRGTCAAGYLMDGEFVSIWRYAERIGAPQHVVDMIRNLTDGEKARVATGT